MFSAQFSISDGHSAVLQCGHTGHKIVFGEREKGESTKSKSIYAKTILFGFCNEIHIWHLASLQTIEILGAVMVSVICAICVAAIIDIQQTQEQEHTRTHLLCTPFKMFGNTIIHFFFVIILDIGIPNCLLLVFSTFDLCEIKYDNIDQCIQPIL